MWTVELDETVVFSRVNGCELLIRHYLDFMATWKMADLDLWNFTTEMKWARQPIQPVSMLAL